MTTDPTELYPVIAQVAATFAGFGSLASGLGQRRGGDDSRVDAYRLGFMLFASLSTTLLGLLPVALSGLLFGPEWAIRASAVAAMIALAIYAPAAGGRILKIRHVAGLNVLAGLSNSACTLTAFIAFALCALDLPNDRLPQLYLLGLMSLLVSSVIMFSRVIVSMLRPHSEEESDGIGR